MLSKIAEFRNDSFLLAVVPKGWKLHWFIREPNRDFGNRRIRKFDSAKSENNLGLVETRI